MISPDIITPKIIHYFAATIAIILGAIGGGAGQGIAGLSVLKAMRRQPTGSESIFRAMIIGLALIESGIVIALVMALIILFGGEKDLTTGIALAELGIGLAIGVAAMSISLASSFVVKAATTAISRQPFFANKIITLMLLSQSIIEAPIAFTFIMSFLIKANIHPEMTILEGIKSLSAGIAIAIGCIGPSIGQAIFTATACKSVGINKKAYNKIFPFTLLSVSIIETPIIFCLLISLIITFTQTSIIKATLQEAIFITSAIMIGIGSIGTATGLGYVTSKSCKQIAQNPDNYTALAKTTLLVIAFIESAIVYAMIVALFLLMKAS